MNNNNNGIYTNTFLGTSHLDSYKISSNFIISTSNILENHLSNTSNILENNLSNTSNILENNSSNFTTITSNLILARYDPLIKEKQETISLPPSTYKHTYITNSNLLGEIRFWCESTKDFIVVIPAGVPDYRVKIDIDGKLKVYYTYDPAINLTFFNGWVDVGNSIASLNATTTNIGISLGGLEAQITTNFDLLEGEIHALLTSLMGHGIINQTTYDDIRESLDIFTTSEFGQENSITNVYNDIKGFFNTARISYLNDAMTGILYNITLNPITATFLGIGGVAFGFAVGYIQNQGYLNTISARINENLNSNTVITPERRADVLASNSADITNTYTELCSNMYNFSISQGFINFNITTEQYIKSLKCDELNLNNSNINNIGTLNATTGIFGSISTTTNTNKSAPSIGYFGGIADKIILAAASSQINYPYSIGINLSSLWNSIPASNTFDWYINGSIDFIIN